MKKRGSAIVIAILIVVAIGGIAFSFGKIFLLDAANANITQSGIGAYYAAESGIEEGLLRYRYDRDAEVPTKSWQLGQSSVFETNMNANWVDQGTNSSGITKASNTNFSDGDQIYDLRMGFVGTNGLPIYGQNTDSNTAFNISDVLNSSYGQGDYSFLKISKDDDYKIDLSNLDFNSLSNNDINLYAKYSNLTDANAIMSVKLTIDDGLGNITETKSMISSNVNGSCGVLGRTDFVCISNIINAPIKTISGSILVWETDKLLQSFQGQFGITLPLNSNKKVTLSLKPLYGDAYIGIVTANCSSSFANCSNKTNTITAPYTIIASTGYFGGVTRTIETKIDRQSGTLYDLYDYVLKTNN